MKHEVRNMKHDKEGMIFGVVFVFLFLLLPAVAFAQTEVTGACYVAARMQVNQVAGRDIITYFGFNDETETSCNRIGQSGFVSGARGTVVRREFRPGERHQPLGSPEAPSWFREGGQQPQEQPAGGFFVGLENCVTRGDCTLEDFVRLAVNIANWMLGIAGALALLFLVLGGFKLIMSQGAAGTELHPGGHASAKKTLTNAVIGLIIVLTAWIGVRFVLTELLGLEVSQGLRIDVQEREPEITGACVWSTPPAAGATLRREQCQGQVTESNCRLLALAASGGRVEEFVPNGNCSDVMLRRARSATGIVPGACSYTYPGEGVIVVHCKVAQGRTLCPRGLPPDGPSRIPFDPADPALNPSGWQFVSFNEGKDCGGRPLSP